MTDEVGPPTGNESGRRSPWRDAAGEGRLTLEELTRRLDFAYRAVTRAELSRLTADLPSVATRQEVGAPAGRRWVVAVMSGAVRKGRWRPGGRVTALVLVGGIDITVPEGVEVHVGDVSLMGGKHVKLADVPLAPGGPVIEVRAISLMGGVTVRSKQSAAAGELPAA